LEQSTYSFMPEINKNAGDYDNKSTRRLMTRARGFGSGESSGSRFGEEFSGFSDVLSNASR
jgi:hypothetical protein